MERKPLVLVVANNQYAYSTPTSRQFVCDDLVDKAVGYGVAGHSLDGTDLEACLEVLARAVAAARGGGGRSVLVIALAPAPSSAPARRLTPIRLDPQAAPLPLGGDCLKLAEQRACSRELGQPARAARIARRNPAGGRR